MCETARESEGEREVEQGEKEEEAAGSLIDARAGSGATGGRGGGASDRAGRYSAR